LFLGKKKKGKCAKKDSENEKDAQEERRKRKEIGKTNMHKLKKSTLKRGKMKYRMGCSQIRKPSAISKRVVAPLVMMES